MDWVTRSRRRQEIHIFHHLDEDTVRGLVCLFTKEIRKMAGTAEEILAKIESNTGILNSLVVAADELNDQSTDIASEIQRLKDIIAAGQTPDLSALEAKVDEQKAVIDGLQSAIKANPAPGEPAA